MCYSQQKTPKRKDCFFMQGNIEKLKSYLIAYVNEITTKSKGNLYICPICKSGTGQHKTGAFNIVPNTDNQVWKCHSCGRGGTIIDLYGYMNDIDPKTKDGTREIVQTLEAKYNLTNDFSFPRISTEKGFKSVSIPEESHADDNQVNENEEDKAYKEYEEKEIHLCIGACKHTVGFSDYLTKRGISLEVQKKFNIGYFGEWLHPKTKYYHRGNPHIHEWFTPRIVIPTSDSSYLARATTPEPPQDDPRHKYYVKAYKVGGVKIFNPLALTSTEGYCFVVEGEIDALSCIECGFNAIGLGSTSMADRLFRDYEIDKNVVLIVAMDNDKSGDEATTKLVELCRKHKQPYTLAYSDMIFNGAKDCNEALQKDKTALIEQLEYYKKKALEFDKEDFLKSLEAETLSNEKGNAPLVVDDVAHQEEPTKKLPTWAYLSERGKVCINEKNYCKYITDKLQIKTIKGRILTIDKELEESELENIVFNEISEYISQDLAPRTKKLISAIKMFSFSQSFKVDSKIINFQNGTYNVTSRGFENRKYWCINRLNVNYNPNAPRPTKWLNYLNELLNRDDITTLQEFLGYCLIPTCKAQIMLFLIGSGGEGKSVIADILRALMGDNNINDDKIHELQNNRFKIANCENKLLNIDDDLNFKALSDTGLIKSVVAGANISVEQKGKQAYKIKPYCRLLAFGNGTLTSLYDHSDGFYRRQVIINTKPKRQDRIDNPFLADEIIENELEGILLWCLEGLHRLIEHGFKIYVSQASKKAIEDIKSEAFNFVDYLQDSDEVQFDENYEEPSIEIYASYCNWCYNNALKPLKNRSVLTYLKDHAEEYNIKPSNHIVKSGKQARGFKGIRVAKYNQSAIC